MQSATSRLNSIVMFGATVLLAMSVINHIHGRYILYKPTPEVTLNNLEVTQFRNTSYWEQLSFKYDLVASTLLVKQIWVVFILGISNNCLSILKLLGSTKMDYQTGWSLVTGSLKVLSTVPRSQRSSTLRARASKSNTTFAMYIEKCEVRLSMWLSMLSICLQ